MISDVAACPITVRFRGVRGSIPSPGIEMARYGGNTSCVELRCGDDFVILDAGSGIRGLGSELLHEFGSQPIEANLLISHTHWDHIQGLPFFAPGYSPANRFQIVAAHGYGSRVQLALTNQMSALNFPVALDQMRGVVAVEELAAGTTQLGAFVVRTTELNHPGGCAGFRLEAGGFSVAYLPDHEPFHGKNDGELLDFIRDLDLLILDTQYTAEEYSRRAGWGHGCLPESVRLALAGDVHRLLLFHHDPTHDDHQIDQMVRTARDLAKGSTLIVDAAAENQPIRLARPLSAPIMPPSASLPLRTSVAV